MNLFLNQQDYSVWYSSLKKFVLFDTFFSQIVMPEHIDSDIFVFGLNNVGPKVLE